jgi:RimJ/RimL family protein N-acetyltransferase
MIPIPEQLILETDKVILRPLSETDYDEMLQLAGLDPDMWYYFSLNLSDPQQLTKRFQLAAA